MLKWFWCWLVGIGCKWETIKETRLFIGTAAEAEAIGTRYIQRCTTCGKIIKRDLA